MPEAVQRRYESAAQSLSSSSEFSPTTDTPSTRTSSSRPRSLLFNQAMAWLSRSPTTPSRPASPTHSSSSARSPKSSKSPKSPRAKPKSTVATPPASPPTTSTALPPLPSSKPTRDESPKPAVRSKEYEQALMDPEVYTGTVSRAKLVNVRNPDRMSPGSVPSRSKASGSPPQLQIRTGPKMTATPRRSSLKRSAHDIPPSPSFPPSAIAPFNRLVGEQSTLPPFDPQLLAGPPPPGTYSKNSLVTLETSSMTMRTTIDTLTSRPSLLAQYILSLCPSPPSGPPKVPSEVIHIFLDRPSPPYHIILSYLRLPRSSHNDLPALPRAVQLPSRSQTTSMIGVSKLEALLDLRDEACWLGLEELEAMCETELRNAGLVKPKQATIAEETEPPASSESDLPATTVSSAASATPSFSSSHNETVIVFPPARNIPTPPLSSEDSDARPSARPRPSTTPTPTSVAPSIVVPRARPTQHRLPTSPYLESRPLPAVPPSSLRLESVRRGSAPSIIAVPSAKPVSMSRLTGSLTEEEKARRAKEKLSEALRLRRMNGGSPNAGPASPTRTTFPAASPGRYL
ncbi:hypothetical protein CALCODRAFT_490431 [Calocera cornea HHB12733]|uniref:BTB domain-containing protein n=1 Tax=Calocera cornea HHB12733 TaxID=1353952 RepID=A0A165JST8_9BASI|nr:hypothetical protein CALCODRAFT_490431 [Calocera cornea HHB12733]